MTGELILVGGINAPKYKTAKTDKTKWIFQSAQPGPWREFCLRVAEHALRINKGLQVTLFDFFEGTREVVKLDAKGKRKTSIEQKLGKLNFSNYRRVDVSDTRRILLVPPETELRGTNQPHIRYFTGIDIFSKGTVPIAVPKQDYSAAWSDWPRPTEASISITNLYEYIRMIGTTRPHTIAELHLFSHAWAGGPVLVDTIDGLEEVSRAPWDKDGRAKKDFEAVNMVNPQDFAKAFNNNATIHVWGCNAWRFMKRLVQETLRQKQHVKDTSMKALQFHYNTDWYESETEFHELLGGVSGSRLSDKMSVNDVITILLDALESTYMKQLAVCSGVRVLGGLPGTESRPDKKREFGELLLHVPMGIKYGDVDGGKEANYQSILNFYKDDIGVTFEPKDGYSPVFGRGYGIFMAGS